MNKEKIITSIGNVDKFKKAVLLINNLQDNYNKMISTDDAKEQAFSCQVCIKLLEMSKEIITEEEVNFLKLFDDINSELDKKHNGSVDDYVKNILIEPNEDLVINCEYPDIQIGDTNTYTITTNNTVTWGLTNNGNGVTLGLTGINGECTVTCDFNTDLIGRVETLTAYLDYGATVTKEIPIFGRI